MTTLVFGHAFWTLNMSCKVVCNFAYGSMSVSHALMHRVTFLTNLLPATCHQHAPNLLHYPSFKQLHQLYAGRSGSMHSTGAKLCTALQG